MNTKRPKLSYDNHHGKSSENSHHHEENQSLIPGLPDHIAHLCLSKLPPSLLYNVSPLWRRLIYSPLFPPFLSLYALLSPITTKSTTPIHFSSFDPISATWQSLPPPPNPPDLHLLSRHPSFISRNLPIQAVTAGDSLVVVAATSHHLLPALPRPLVFDPLALEHGTNNGGCWSHGPVLPVPRRWCAVGSLGASVYVASGVGSHFSTYTARSVEKWDLLDGAHSQWVPMTALKDGRFAREAVDAVGWRGRLLVVNVAAKEGAVYDEQKDTWREMDGEMVEGWWGPGAAMDEEEIFVVDQGKGVLRRYECGGGGGGDDVEERENGGGCWVDVVENERLRGAQQVAARGGRVCVVCGGGEILVVDVVAKTPRMWVVEPPNGFKAVAVHILPRMTR